LSYKEQPSPDGLAQAFILGEDFIGDDDVCLVLGDNVFYGAGLQGLLSNAVATVLEQRKAVVFGNYVHDPERYGVAEFDEHQNVVSIEEKPAKPKSNFAVVGLYFYPNSVVKIAKNVKPSHRGELEITSVNEAYLSQGNLTMQILSRGFAWLDTGTHESLSEATEFVKAVEKRTGLKIACLEEISLKMKWLNKVDISKDIEGKKGEYYSYLAGIVK
jgi:glucose-1-phosphate thymidylyltransferase